MSAFIKFSLQSITVVSFAAVVSCGLLLVMNKTQNTDKRLHAPEKNIGTTDEDGGVAFFVETPKPIDLETAVSVTTSEKPISNLNVAPPHKHDVTLVKVADLGKFMKEARLVRKQCDMAALKAATGLTEEQLLKIESGLAIPTPDIANELENVLKIEVKFSK